MEEVEKRSVSRTPTRLRPGKLIGKDGAFVSDCAIVDRSAAGVKVGLFDSPTLCDAMCLFDETDRERRKVRLVWHAGGFAGLSFAGEAEEVDPIEAQRIAGRYYALR